MCGCFSREDAKIALGIQKLTNIIHIGDGDKNCAEMRGKMIKENDTYYEDADSGS